MTGYPEKYIIISWTKNVNFSLKINFKNKLTCLAVGSFPPVYADFITVFVAGVVPEYVVARSTKFGAGCIVVMIRALNP